MSHPVGGGNVWHDPDCREGVIAISKIPNPVRANPQAQQDRSDAKTNRWRDPDEIGTNRSMADIAKGPAPAPLTPGQIPMMTMDQEVGALKKQIKELGLEGSEQSKQLMRQIAQTEYNRKDGPRPAVRGALARWGIGSPKAED